MPNYKTKRKLSRILPFGIIWVLLGWLFLFIEHADGTDNSQTDAINLNFPVFLFATFAVFLVGILVGYIELSFLNRRFHQRPFYQKILFKLIFYLMLFSLVMLILYPIAASIELDTSVFSKTVWTKYFSFLKSMVHFSTMVQLSASLFLSLIYAEISDNLGHGVLLNFFTGKYHNPIEEFRIFLFTDMKDSTSIAEKLGTKKYFLFLRDYYNAVEDAIIKFGGEVYQYIGDEIVITWEYQMGVKNYNCLHTFFEMKDALATKSSFFLESYGYAPSFKGGMHFGEVTTGEIGALKKEIVFTGDILNTTARIQAACNPYKTDFLISMELLDRLKLEDKMFSITKIGNVALKGKNESLILAKVERNLKHPN
ncbi:adenylate/guanylate cyclase domain-containing protein [Maribacter sp. PR1]|uniref:Adenylate/guanylate cyclase domain-containing protein n=1 Tax=Maribacter cobaltidurans TaxID=1178778 RepID=A0ABU7IZU9_9FLAO|nr:MULTISPECIES: adenylate/guanylate cyclase domain-containing protein [Maribacter]MDC6391130.1 adenylate/guanylate cyclase domain-containing protein [Maribacter sp. PR1]MEE1978522.1 adenylate/guanylate cyclase domain-containing protein [Maribacter cobaltidurans]